MLKYKHILVALDLSDYTDTVLKAAKDIATGGKDTQISLIHVIEGSTAALGGEIMMPMDINFEQTIENHVREQTNNLAKKHHIAEDHIYIEKIGRAHV